MLWLILVVLIGLYTVAAQAQSNPSLQYPSMKNPTSQYPTSQYPTSQYPSMRYPSSPPQVVPPTDPAEVAAQQQSGLSKDEAQALLQGKGYTWLNNVEADPNSIWVWQADAMKDGRPVRVGVDYRGEVLVIAPEANRPCTSLGGSFGPGGLGVGPLLSATRSCANP